MTEMERIADLLEETFEGKPYYGPSVMGALESVTADRTTRKLRNGHSIWEIVAHLTAELEYALAVIDGTAGEWIEGETTWAVVTDMSEDSWNAVLRHLEWANRAFVERIRRLDDGVLDETPIQVSGPFYRMLHGTMQHSIYHSGQISLLARHGQDASVV